MRVFVCYSPTDLRFAQELFAVLTQQEFVVVRSTAFVKASQWQTELLNSPIVLYILSQGAGEDANCQAQWQFALEHEKRLIVLKLNDVPIPDPLGHLNLIDYMDFEQIGRQIAEGIPALIKDRYASEVTLRMLIAELAEMRRQENDESQAHLTLPPLSDLPPATPTQQKWEARPVPPLKRLAKHLRRRRHDEGEA